jgi:hypothetical protein
VVALFVAYQPFQLRWLADEQGLRLLEPDCDQTGAGLELANELLQKLGLDARVKKQRQDYQ